jgi:hypothetical protein
MTHAKGKKLSIKVKSVPIYRSTPFSRANGIVNPHLVIYAEKYKFNNQFLSFYDVMKLAQVVLVRLKLCKR